MKQGWRLGLVVMVMLVASAQAGKPRAALMYEEQVRGVFGISGSWMEPGQGEARILEALHNAGYSVVDSQTLRANVLREQAIQVLAGDQKAAVAVGSKLQAPLVIVGNGYAKTAGNVAGSSMKSMQASVQLKAIDSASGEVVAFAAGTAAKPHVDEVTGGGEALGVAAGDAIGKLLETLAKHTWDTPPGEQLLRVSISGLRSYRHYLFIKEWLEKNLAKGQRLAAETYTTGTADLELRGPGNGSALAARIAKASFEGFVVNPVDVSEAAVTLKVIMNEQK